MLSKIKYFKLILYDFKLFLLVLELSLRIVFAAYCLGSVEMRELNASFFFFPCNLVIVNLRRKLLYCFRVNFRLYVFLIYIKFIHYHSKRIGIISLLKCGNGYCRMWVFRGGVKKKILSIVFASSCFFIRGE